MQRPKIPPKVAEMEIICIILDEQQYYEYISCTNCLKQKHNGKVMPLSLPICFILEINNIECGCSVSDLCVMPYLFLTRKTVDAFA
jgi:hypothetical protein